MITEGDMPAGYRLEEATAGELLIVDEGQPDLRLWAILDKDGVAVFYIQAKADETGWRGSVRGTVLFELMIRHFGAGIRSIQSCWASGTNYETFKNLLNEGATIHEAASNTWTGKRAQNHGFLAVLIRRLTFLPQPNAVTVDFYRTRISE